MKQPPNLIVDEDEPDSGHAGPSLPTVLAALLLAALVLVLLMVAAAELGRIL